MYRDLILGMLFSIAQALEGPRISTVPEIIFRTEVEMHHACGDLCMALYQTPTIYLSESVDLDTVRGQGILYHELVHHYQEETSRYTSVGQCMRWNFREQEAYSLQDQWYQAQGSHIHSFRTYRRC